MPKPTLVADLTRVRLTPIRVTIVTMDTHLATATARATARLVKQLPGLSMSLHAASEWSADEKSLARCIEDIARADIVIATMLFMEDHFLPILPALEARRESCDAMVCAMSASEVVRLTRIGKFDMNKPASGLTALLKRLRGNKDKKSTGGAAQMKMLRRVPKFLRFIPGTAQDVRSYFLTLQYWLGGSEENMFNMIRYLINKYAAGPREVLRGADEPALPIEYPELGVYHPRLPSRMAEEAHELPVVVPAASAKGRVGLLELNKSSSYVFISVGGNDILKTSAGTSEDNVRALFDKYMNFLSALRVRLGSTKINILNLYLPANPRYQSYKKIVDKWNQLLEEYSNKIGAMYNVVDIHSLLTGPADFVYDIEPSESGSKKIANAIYYVS